MEEIAAQKTAYWEGSREGPSRRKRDRAARSACASRHRAARRRPGPNSLLPQLATLVTRLPEGGHWLSEIKFDGYRLLAWIKEGR